MKKSSGKFRRGLSDSIDTIFAPIVVEIMTRTTMMSYVSLALTGSLDQYVADFQATYSHEFQDALSARQLQQLKEIQQQFKEVTLTSGGGEELTFLARVPEGCSLADVVEPNAELIEAAMNLRDNQILEVSCSQIQEFSPSPMMMHGPRGVTSSW